MERSSAAVTIVIPTKNRPEWLREAVRSVLHLGESLAGEIDVRVIVVNDGEPAGLDFVAALPSVTMVPCAGKGVSAARNTGIFLAETPYVGFLDDDDVFLESHIKPFIAVLEQRPEVALVFGQGMLTDPFLSIVTPPGPHGPLPDGEAYLFSLENCLSWNTAIMRTAIARELGGFDARLSCAEDWEFALRVAAKHDCVGLEIPVTLYRQRASAPNLDRRIQDFRATAAVVRNGARLHARVQLPMRQRLLLSMPVRGWFAARFALSAEVALAAGNRPEALRALWWALRASPAHSLLRLPVFWKTSIRLARSLVERRESRPGDSPA